MNLKPIDIDKKKKEDKYYTLGNKGGLGIEGLEPSRLIKSADFPFTRNFIVVSIDM